MTFKEGNLYLGAAVIPAEQRPGHRFHTSLWAEQITRALRQRHAVGLADNDDFSVITQADLVAILGEVTGLRPSS